MIKKLNLFILFLICIVILSGCSSEEVTSLSDIDNPYQEPTVSLRNIVANEFEFFGEEVIVGPVVVYINHIERSSFTVRPIAEFYESGNPKLDFDVSIEIFYDDTENKSKWIDLKTSDDPIIFIKGEANYYSNVNKLYISAIDIIQYNY